ncbi:hypothetical protein AB0B28_03820 [Glycomyces sp. NPDC046736]|uniref:hypothetical protein n=1 Tax=Glycomyces sp. NPDC046736 TaxID=3155615 RepID=UPI0033D3E5AE
MDHYAILALQIVQTEATSALPDAPVVPERPGLFSRLGGGLAAVRRTVMARGLGIGSLKRAEVRRAA